MFKLTDYIPRAELETFCRKNHIIRMSLFGSALREELKQLIRFPFLCEGVQKSYHCVLRKKRLHDMILWLSIFFEIF